MRSRRPPANTLLRLCKTYGPPLPEQNEPPFELAANRGVVTGRLVGAAVKGRGVSHLSANWGAATALRHRALARLTSLPRMADFARWATECDPAPGPAWHLTQTARRPSKTSWQMIRWQFACPTSWRNAAGGWEGPRNFCAQRMIVVVATARAPAGQKIRRCPRGGYVGRRERSFAYFFQLEGRAGNRTISSSGARATSVRPVSTVGAVCHDISGGT